MRLLGGDRRLSQLDLTRGIWNLSDNYGRVRLLGPEAAYNRIVLGPLHTLHHLDGRPAESAYWISVGNEPPRSHNIANKYKQMRRAEIWLRRALKDSPYARHIEECVIRYCRALDEVSSETSFLKLWAVLERLTITPSTGDHRVTVRRTAALFREDRQYHLSVLNSLRESRNRMVHEGAETEGFGVELGHLKGYVEALLAFLIDHARTFRNAAEIGDFLDITGTPDRLKRDIQIRRFAISFPKGRPRALRNEG